MGKLGFTTLQRDLFTSFSKEKIASQFYFTGGTALSVFYFKHRISDDLDFFTESKFDVDEIIKFIKNFAGRKNLGSRYTQRSEVHIFELTENKKPILKIDFNFYPHKRVEEGKKKESNLEIDSLRDIAVNKLLTINQRTDIKDFVDLFYLLKKFTIWDLIYGVEYKFGLEFDILLIAADFLKVEEFKVLPEMLTPLKLTDLVKFYKGQAKKISKRIIK